MKRILLIEDDQVLANIYRNKFAVEGFSVEIARDGEEGLALIQRFKPDAVILDLVLPKLSGLEVIKRVRAEPATQSLPLIVFSNTYLGSLVQEAWKAGATKCLSKATCIPRQVVDIVRTVLAIDESGAPLAPTSPDPRYAVAVPASAPASAPGQVPVSADGPSALSTPGGDAEFQAELRRSFIETLPATLAGLRAALQAMIKADNEVNRLKLVNDLYRRIHALTGNAGLADMPQIAHMTDAVEALLKELYEKPRNLNASTLRTVAMSIDFLGVLFEHSRFDSSGEIPPASVLVVDDEAISRRAVTYALEKARLKSVALEDPNVALKLVSENQFDLVVLDVDMPGMTGFELCSRLRAMPHHKTTPVVFVTSLNDFESRASSTMSGGTDFIAKPFLFIELAVKSLMYVLRQRIPPIARS
jgi:DNA-binding response OmpR family regulator/HPt (histidine-containing phosphotransfer) domain-containing protein